MEVTLLYPNSLLLKIFLLFECGGCVCVLFLTPFSTLAATAGMDLLVTAAPMGVGTWTEPFIWFETLAFIGPGLEDKETGATPLALSCCCGIGPITVCWP